MSEKVMLADPEAGVIPCRYADKAEIAGGGVTTIVAGSGISVDDTDPANPIVTNTGGVGTQDLASVLTVGNDPDDTPIQAATHSANGGAKLLVSSGIAGSHAGGMVEAAAGDSDSAAKGALLEIRGALVDGGGAVQVTAGDGSNNGNGGIVTIKAGAAAGTGINGSIALDGLVDAKTHRIVNVVNPIDPQDADTKAARDAAIAAISPPATPNLSQVLIAGNDPNGHEIKGVDAAVAAGGDVILEGGKHATSFGGKIRVSGATGIAEEEGGTVFISGGDSHGPDTTGAILEVRGGIGLTGNGGDVNAIAGDASSDGDFVGGNILLKSGQRGGDGAGGNISLIAADNGSALLGGNIILHGGADGGAGAGQIKIESVLTMQTHQIKNVVNPTDAQDADTKAARDAAIAAALVPISGYPAGTKFYRALISQSGTSAPTVKVLQNTLGMTLNWSRSGAGVYIGTAASGTPFTADKTYLMIAALNDASAFRAALSYGSTSAVQLDTLQPLVGTNADGALADRPMEIIVYP